MAGGRQAQLGVKTETTYNTSVAVDQFVEFQEEDMTYNDERLESTGLRAGRSTLSVDQWVPGRAGADGNVTIELQWNGIGLFLEHMMGHVATAEVGDNTPNVFASTFTPGALGGLDGKSFTMQVGRPQLDGTVIPYTYGGCKLPEWELTIEENKIAKLKLTVDAASQVVGGTDANALQTADYVDPTTPYSFARCALTVGGVPVLARKVVFKGGNALETDRWFLGSRTKVAPVEGSGDLTNWSVEMDMDFVSPALYALVASGAPTAVALTCTGPLIDDAGSEYKFTLTLPAVRFDGKTVHVSGPQLLEQTLMGRALDNLTDEPITIGYTSLTAYSTPV